MAQSAPPLARFVSSLAVLALGVAAVRKALRDGPRRSAFADPAADAAGSDGGGVGRAGDRGRRATAPQEIPARGWRDVLARVWREQSEDNISIIAAGCAFFGLLAIFPAITAFVSIYGLVADPSDVERQAAILQGFLPHEAYDILVKQMHDVASTRTGALGWGLVASIALALWSASAGVKTIFAALNIAYEEEEKRSFVVYNLAALAFTLGAILTVLVALAVIVALPVALKFIGLGTFAEWIVSIVRWPILGALIVLGIAVLYRWGPSRSEAKWRWVTWGSTVATVLWLVASILFSFYVSNFASYNETYGSLGAAVIALMWFYVSAYVLLLGAELNSELEHQTARDTTTGPERPRGTRGAWVADHVAETP